MDSPTIALSVSPGPAKGKGSNDKASDDDANAFSISLDVAREEADDNQLASYGVLGNDTGTVTVSIDVAFARLDIKAMDNESFVLAENSNLGVDSISAMIASIVEDFTEDASQSISNVLKRSSSLLSQLVDYDHSGKVQFEAGSASYKTLSTIDALTNRSRDDDDQDPAAAHRYERDIFDRQFNTTG